MKYLFPTYLLFIFLVSCESKPDNTEVAVPSISTTPNPTFPVSNDSSAILNNDAGVALNPQHGQPGHRCDIAVGAPLNTPATTSVQPTSIQPTVTPAVTPSNDTKKTTTNSNAATANMNPQHGEPGHRCDIAVGAPLNSKPTQ